MLFPNYSCLASWQQHLTFPATNLKLASLNSAEISAKILSLWIETNLCYQERLKYLQLPTLAYRRVRGDMIEVYKILTNKYDDEVNRNLGLSKNTCTRGNSLKLSTVRTKYDKRKYFFTIRVVSVWNSLPDSVITAQSINAFKREIDKHWQHEDLLYNYRAKLSGTGVRGLEL